MPYMLQEVARNKYFVVNQLTGRKYSLHPLTKEMAEKQLQAIYLRTKN